MTDQNSGTQRPIPAPAELQIDCRPDADVFVIQTRRPLAISFDETTLTFEMVEIMYANVLNLRLSRKSGQLTASAPPSGSDSGQVPSDSRTLSLAR